MKTARVCIRNVKPKAENVVVLRPDADDDSAIHALRRWMAELSHLPGPAPVAFVAAAFWYEENAPAVGTSFTGWYSKHFAFPVRLLPSFAEKVLERDMNEAVWQGRSDIDGAS